MKLEGKCALVTGGGGGIGRGIVSCLAQEGARVAVADVEMDKAVNVAKEASGVELECLPVKVDVSEPEQIKNTVDRVTSEFGKVEILVNNAGVGASPSHEPGMPLSVKDWDYVYMVNLRAYYLMCEAVIPHMIEQRSGKIVNIASIAGRQGGAGQMMLPYRATKAGVINLTQSLALQLAPHGINVNAICPGIIWTPIWETLASWIKAANPAMAEMELREIFDQSVQRAIPMRREQTPKDIGRAVVFLASEDAKNITGQALNVDGGAVLS